MRYWLQESVLRQKFLFFPKCALPSMAQGVSFYNGVAMKEAKMPFWKA
jgi:hypothetical protein